MAKGTHFTGVAIAPLTITDAATYTVEAANTGKIHILPNLTANITITLPAPHNGLRYEFVYAGAAADAQNWIINTDATTTLFKGGLVHLDTNAGAAGDEVVPVFANFSTHDTMTIVTPNAGTQVTIVCDGSSWIVTGQVASDAVPTFA